MNSTITKKIGAGIFAMFFLGLCITSCVDEDSEEFVAPTGNVNNIQPSTLFTNATNATDPLMLAFRSFSTDAVTYAWDFGDGQGTSTEANPNYTYATGGLYLVKLSTVSSDGLIAEDSAQVSPVFIDFNFTTSDTEVDFENLSTGASMIEWSFGDGESVEWLAEDTEEDADFSPTHIYTSDDIFTATLTATNFLNEDVSISKSIEGLVLSTVPDFTFTTSDLTATFTDNSILAVSYSWDFGDGGSSTEISPTHTYTASGTYDVTLTTTNEAGVSRSITMPVPVGGIEATFAAVVLNGTFDDFQIETGDNADAWDMTPNSNVKFDSDGGAESPSPYRALWNNSDLNGYIDTTYCTNEQPATTSDGAFVAGEATRGAKFSNECRRLYQLVTVEPGVEYTLSIDTRSELEGVNTEIFILNKEITTEVGIDMNLGADLDVDGYVLIDNDFNSSKGSATDNTFTTTTLTFEASSNQIVIYARALNAVDGSSEVFIDNVRLLTPGF